MHGRSRMRGEWYDMCAEECITIEIFVQRFCLCVVGALVSGFCDVISFVGGLFRVVNFLGRLS